MPQNDEVAAPNVVFHKKSITRNSERGNKITEERKVYQTRSHLRRSKTHDSQTDPCYGAEYNKAPDVLNVSEKNLSKQ